MSHYDLILLGESPFTLDLKAEFEGKVKMLFLNNQVFDGQFSTDLFPTTTFVPQRKECEGVFGQLVSDNFRFDMTTNKEITQLMWTEELKEKLETLILIENRSAFELNMANFLFIENFGESFSSIITKHLVLLLKNIKPLQRLYLQALPKGQRELNRFILALRYFFSPGEINTKVYDKYLLYSLLSKKAYSIENDFEPAIQKEDYGLLKGITYGSTWELRFEKQKVTGKILVSALPPHLFTLFDITHPFKIDYDEIFYLVTPNEPIAHPCGMEKELVFIKDEFHCFIQNVDKKESKFFLSAKLNEPVNTEKIKPVISALFPHIITMPTFTIKPHIYPHYKITNKKGLNSSKNLFFLKNYEYPYLGIDGELIYRKMIKEILWKKLL